MGCKLTYDVNMSWERILPLKIYDNFKTWEQIVIFILNIVMSICTLVKNSPISYLYYTYTNWLWVMEMGMHTSV